MSVPGFTEASILREHLSESSTSPGEIGRRFTQIYADFSVVTIGHRFTQIHTDPSLSSVFCALILCLQAQAERSSNLSPRSAMPSAYCLLFTDYCLPMPYAFHHGQRATDNRRLVRAFIDLAGELCYVTGSGGFGTGGSVGAASSRDRATAPGK